MTDGYYIIQFWYISSSYIAYIIAITKARMTVFHSYYDSKWSIVDATTYITDTLVCIQASKHKNKNIRRPTYNYMCTFAIGPKIFIYI